ncbi:unnamed protein product [Ambrosiozyma monospora]|uniref:Unnamed protein product n=1 Tax=Ambrosiozyma monospora TaxID=43982 RepID=A0ACB5T417_AMBMO|nr:unnamed protein product [Ambrosiozyma monospora]
MQAVTFSFFFNSGKQQSQDALVDRKESDSKPDSSLVYFVSVLSNDRSDGSLSYDKEDNDPVSIKGVINPVLGCTFEEALQNILHPAMPPLSYSESDKSFEEDEENEEEPDNIIQPMSPQESFYGQFRPTLSSIPEECESSIALSTSSAGICDSDHDHNVEPNLSTDKNSDVSVRTEKRSHKRRTQAWNLLTRWWHRKNSNVNIEEKVRSNCDNSSVEDKKFSVSSNVEVDVQNDDNHPM